ncbi:MAG: phospho-sugar mutase [Bacilli bacterium]|nr:phospho-sugar mutase [Bacilli bacterium]
MNKDYKKIYEQWLNSSLLNKEEKEELLSIKDDEKAIEDRFYQDLAFGTAGLRGIMEVGANRMNRFIIRKATQGLANYLNKKYKNPSVAIGYDSRNHSEEYSKETAATLAVNGVKVYLYPELMPTPTVSFAVRYYGCSAGVVVTASHNPCKYNGYKVYGDDGCQCTSESADAILEEIEALDVFDDVKVGNYDELVKENKIEIIGDDCFNAFIKSTKKQSIYNEEKVLNLVYTPLYGAGRKCVTTILREDGFEHVSVVKEQEMPNGNFPTCPYPNPEIKEALTLGINQMMTEKADILVATDPDSDRVAVAVNNNGEARILSGNETGILLFDAIYNARKENGTLTKRPILVKTIVSSDMANVIAEDYGVTVKEVLTGFKYIGEQILLLERENNTADYLLGFEESCGYLSNTDVRDKDAVNAVLLIAELANHLKLQGKSLLDRINELYAKYGDFKTSLLTYEFPGVEGMAKIQSLMTMFRNEETRKIIGNIDHIGDYKAGTITYNDRVEPTNLPTSDVVKFFLSDKSTITVRPSGTEPKLKIYMFANGIERINALRSLLDSMVK